MGTEALLSQLQAASDTLKQTNILITRLAKLTFQPGSEPLDGENSVRIELAQDIHDSLKQLEEDLELLQQEVEDTSSSANHPRRRESEKDKENTRLTAQVARFGEDLRHSRGAFRKAQLAAKRASEAAKRKERELVFASLQSPPTAEEDAATEGKPGTPDLFAGRRKLGQTKQLTKEELEADTASNVTAALRRTHDLLSTELSRSRFAQETLDQSTAALADLGEKYADLDTVLSKSRDLLGTLLRSQKSDTWYLETAFYLLLATLGWLIFRRILFGPFVKLPLFLWRLSLVILNWVVWKPLYLFLWSTGVITTGAASGSNNNNELTSSRPPLIVQPSAKGRAQQMPNMQEQMRDRAPGGMPAGAGGGGAKQRSGDVLQGQMSEQIGKMAEEGARQDEPQRRADGTVLLERGDEATNPKKKMFEADVEDEKMKRHAKRDEL